MRLRDFLDWYKTRRFHQARGCRTFDSSVVTLDPPRTIRFQPPKLNRKRLRQSKQAVKKAIRLGSALIGEQRIRAFVSGDGFTIDGVRYRYRLRRVSHVSILEHTASPTQAAIPYELLILRKDDDRPLASGCVYFELTPLLDQVIALCLHVRDHEAEFDLLKTAHLSRYEAFDSDPFFVDLKGARTPLLDRQGIAQTFDRMFGDNEKRTRLQAMALSAVEQVFYETVGVERQILDQMRHPSIRFDDVISADPAWIASVDQMIAQVA
jgi:hypothetical protein